jgi:hypothetical protein
MTIKRLPDLRLYRLTCDNALCPLAYDESAKPDDTPASARARIQHYHGAETRLQNGQTFDLCYSCAARDKRVSTERRKSREIIAWAKRQWAARLPPAKAQFKNKGTVA